MSVTIRPYVNEGWEADIRVVLPDGSAIRERRKASLSAGSCFASRERWNGWTSRARRRS